MRTSSVTTSVDQSATATFEPDLQQLHADVAGPQSLAGVGGMMVSTSSTIRLINWRGRSPKASSARRAVPNRLVTSGKSAPVTLRKTSAGPLAAITPMDLGRLEHQVDGRIDVDDVTVTLQPGEKLRRSGNDTA